MQSRISNPLVIVPGAFEAMRTLGEVAMEGGRIPRRTLELTQAATRLSDRAEAVPDEIWNEAAQHYDEQALAQLVLSIATINAWNRVNVITRQIAGSWAAADSGAVAAA